MESSGYSPLNLGKRVRSFTISTELGKEQLLSFPRFLRQVSDEGKLGTITARDFNLVAGEGGKFLIFNTTFGGGPIAFLGTQYLEKPYNAIVRMKIDSPLLVEIFSDQGDNPKFARRLEDYILLKLQFFEEGVREDTIYISFIPGSEPTSRILPRRKLMERVFSGNMLVLILFFLIIAFVLYYTISSILGPILTPVILLALMLSIMLSAGKIMAIRSEWRITRKHKEVVTVKFHLDRALIPEFMRLQKSHLSSIKKEIFYLMTNKGDRADSSDIVDIFSKYGISITREQIVIKRVNIYDIVERAADQFNMPMPATVITRKLLPNAAATGFSKHLATMLITIGLLIQLDEREIELVVGHELSHLRSGDPAILFTFFGAEYLLRIYVFLPYIEAFGILYLIFIFWLIFFFGKLLEARADLEAALILRDPQIMATSLKKIGFRKLALDDGFVEGRKSGFMDWLAFDPHPPIGFRIRRLESLDLSRIPKHTFLRSVSDVLGGIASSIRR